MEKTRSYFILALFIIFLIYYKYSFNNNKISLIDKNISKVKVSVLVFYGRKRYVKILSKYLIANLKKNNGILDQIKFAVNTNNKEDLDYLNKLIKLYPNEFIKYNFNNTGFRNLYNCLEDDEFIFKIDDDIVFIKNNTFELMLKEYIQNNHIFLSANVINHPRLSDVHARMGTMQSILFKKDILKLVKNCSFNIPGHDGTKNWWRYLDCFKLAHESFIHNFYSNNLDSYDFVKWDLHFNYYERYSINFVLGMGRYFKLIKEFNIDDDEVVISIEIPKKFNQHTYSFGKAIVSHFAYYPQRDIFDETNLLKSYKKLTKLYFNSKKKLH